MRVQLAGSQYLVLGEVQVWSQQSVATDVEWMVSDHLGTPRIMADATGSLAGVKRHDYLPFGEEVPSNLRSGMAGYGGSDSLRQKFTQYERDIESSLDYAQARYYSSVQGRFTSIDPLMASANIGDPQSFNRYAYVLNRPTTLTDPSGRCPKGRKCYYEPDGNGGTNEYYDDDEGNPVLVAGTAKAKRWPLIALALVTPTITEEFKIVLTSEKVLYSAAPKAASAPAAAGPGFFAKMLGAIGLILSNPISIGCGQTPNTVADGSGGCMHVDPEPDTSANPDPEAEKPDTSDNNEKKEFKEPKSNVSGKDGAKDIPSWGKGKRPYKGESGKQFAERVCTEQYGEGNYTRGPGSEFSKLKKYADRSFK